MMQSLSFTGQTGKICSPLLELQCLVARSRLLFGAGNKGAVRHTPHVRDGGRPASHILDRTVRGVPEVRSA